MAGPLGDGAVRRRHEEVRRDPVRTGDLSACVVDASVPAPSRDAVIAGLLDSDPTLLVVVLAESFDDQDAVGLLQMGVRGLVRHAGAAEQLPRALGAVTGGAYWAPRWLIGRAIDSMLRPVDARALESTSRLSRREEEVLTVVVENLSNKEIAQRLHISERTVKFHVSNLLSKFGVGRRIDLIGEALRYRGILGVRVPRR